MISTLQAVTQHVRATYDEGEQEERATCKQFLQVRTAAEIVARRANAAKDHIGLTAWSNQSKGGPPRKADAHIAKNYLVADEIEALNRIVTAYLEFAELQAMSRRSMIMRDWIAKLDDFLALSDRDILTHAGTISADIAKAPPGGAHQRPARMRPLRRRLAVR